MKKYVAFLLFLLFFVGIGLQAQKIDQQEIKTKIAAFKSDPKGPYQQLMWFCPDGSRVPPKERCPEKGGVQRAVYKAWVDTLSARNHIYLGQILAATDFTQFLDRPNNFSRMKQYQLEQYLKAVDNGWVQQKAIYYRGAFQDEDENSWGQRFLHWMLQDTALISSRYLMIKQVVGAIPHQNDNSNVQKVRALSKEIADSVPAFMNLRIKIHGQPDASDLKSVKDFKQRYGTALPLGVKPKLDLLIDELNVMHKPADWSELSAYAKQIGLKSPAGSLIQNAIAQLTGSGEAAEKVKIAAALLLDIRKSVNSAPAKARLAMIDCANKTESLLFGEIQRWQAPTLWQVLNKDYYLTMAAAGGGFVELWEWDRIQKSMLPPNSESISLASLENFMVQTRRIVEWGTAMVRANYGTEIQVFEAFEPLATGFADDIIRSSVLLYLGDNVGMLGKLFYSYSSLTNSVFNIPNQSQIRGLNPGFAKGQLVVADSPEGIEIDASKIYVFLYPPADLKPVAGIATVSEGNLVSHVQLLARNLGIPNAVVSQSNLDDLRKYSGKEVFYAVSNKGTVILKPSAEMTEEEKLLFEIKKRTEDKIRVPIERMDLKQQTVLNLRKVNARSSGVLCGPKAANLGQLKLMFPDQVVEGLVIPFGIFKQHMDQPMPGNSGTYWDFLSQTFKEASLMGKNGKSKTETDQYVLGRLESLRNAILEMPLLDSFVDDLKAQFQNILGKPMGSLPVFLRSDTNMEDLKDFTGAGLNLTLFNVLDEQKIMKGIKQVWASPYSERSFRWRQSYLLNPESVFPSILVIPSVNVDYSGVLITKGLVSGNTNDLTIAFSRGAGGAVDGQSAESYLLASGGSNVLLAPAREPSFNTLPLAGGTGKAYASFEQPILNSSNLSDIRTFAANLKQKMAESRGMQGPFDVELGFLQNKLWLFQVRPFVENRNANGNAYLESITPVIDGTKRVPLNQNMQ